MIAVIISLVVLLAVVITFGVTLAIVDQLHKRKSDQEPAIVRLTGIAAYVSEVVTVHLVNGDTLQGALVENLPSGILLKGASFLGDESAIPLGGETFIKADRISFMQARTE